MVALLRVTTPAPEVSKALFWIARLLLKVSVPALTSVSPLNVLAPERVSVPVPFLVRPPPALEPVLKLAVASVVAPPPVI